MVKKVSKTIDNVEAYPLSWPNSWPRTIRPERARFGDHSVGYARNLVLDELRKLGAKNVVISSNMTLRLDGLLRSGQREPEDSGVAVYFILNGFEQCFPCDRWDKVSHNLWAIQKSIEALRGLERWGAKDMVKAAFSGFKALPSPDMITPMVPQYFQSVEDENHLRERYKRLAKELHPDKGGDAVEFSEMKRQYDQVKRTFK